MAKPKNTPDEGKINDSATDATAALQESLDRMAAQNAELMQALIAAQRQNKEVARDLDLPAPLNAGPVVQVERTGGAALSFSLLDRFGNAKSYRLGTIGETIWLSLEQLEELKNKAPGWFEKGYLTVKGDSTNMANVVRGVQEILSLPVDKIQGRIEKITEHTVLMRLYFELDSSRFTTEDEKGEPLRNDKGEIIAKARDLSPAESVLFHAVANKLQQLTGQVVQLSDG